MQVQGACEMPRSGTGMSDVGPGSDVVDTDTPAGWPHGLAAVHTVHTSPSAPWCSSRGFTWHGLRPLPRSRSVAVAAGSCHMQYAYLGPPPSEISNTA
jgi:hypothetical protein